MEKDPLEKVAHNSNIRRWLPLAVGGLLLVGAGTYFGAGWYVSSEMLAVTLQDVKYDQRIAAIEGNTYTIEGGAYDVGGVMGGVRQDNTPDGAAIGIFGKPSNLNSDAKTSKRTLEDVHGELPKVGESLSLQGNIWTSNPREALGLEYSDVQYPGPLGNMNAWMVPAMDGAEASKTWTIAVHGVGAPRSELLRFIKPIHEASNNVLAINYRNDANNPASPDGYNHLGDTEWQDLQAAIRYARQQGAETVNLFGVSIGGSVVENYLRRAPDEETAAIGRVILDSPALDWKQIVTYRIQSKGYPGLLAPAALAAAGFRADINFNELSTKPGSIKHKTVIIHSGDDRNVPVGPSREVAAAQPDLVTYYDFGQGGHARSWNDNPKRYEQIVGDFLRIK